MNNRTLNLHTTDMQISIALMVPFVVLTIQYFILLYFNILGTSTGSKIQLLSKIIVGLSFLYVLPSIIKQNILKLISIYFVSIFLFLVNYLMFPENQSQLNELIFPFFFMSLPSFIYSLSLTNWHVLKYVMIKASYVVFILGTVLSILIFTGKVTVGAYSMTLSYYMLLPAIIFMDQLLEKLSLRMLLISLISIIVILSLGSRGAILCLIIFVMFKIVRFKLTYSKMLYNLITLSAIFIVFFYLDKILSYLESALLLFGIRSRSIHLLLGEEVYLSGRDNIYERLLTEILDNPIIGIGLGADRRFVESGYAHNFILEVLLNYGLLLGSLILVTVIILLFKGIFTKDDEKYNIITIWISLGFVHLMVSSSYLIDFKFWILLGILLSSVIKKYRFVYNSVG